MSQGSKDSLLIDQLPDAFARHQIIRDEQGEAIDYIFIQVNPAFEEITGLKKEEILNKPVTEVLPGIGKSQFDWIKEYGRIAKSGDSNRFEQYSEPMGRFYDITVYSDEPGYFVTIFRDITDLKKENYYLDKLTKLSDKIYHSSIGSLDHEFFTEELMELSGAKFVAFNTYDQNLQKTTTRAISGINQYIDKASRMLGFRLLGKEWDINPDRINSFNGYKLTRFDNLYDSSFGAISKEISKLLEKMFDLGNVYVIKITYNGQIIGDFIFLMPKNKKIDNSEIIELYVRQLGVVFMKNQAEKSLKNQKDLLNSVFDNIQNGMSVLNSDLTIRYTNGVIKNWHESDLPLEGKKCYRAYHKRDKPCDHCPAVKSLESGKMEKEEFSVKTDLGEKWIELWTYPLFEENSNGATGVVEFINDITERKQAEMKLKRLISEQKLLLDNIEVQVWYLNDIENYGKVNDAHAKFFGVTKQDLEHKSLWEIVNSEEEARLCIDGNVRVFNEKRQIKTEEWVENGDGEARLLSVTKTPDLDENNNVNFVVCSAVDITEQRKMEENLKASEDRFQKLLTVIPDLVSIQDPDMNIIYSNWNGVGNIEEEKRVLNSKCYKTYRGYDEICPDCSALEAINRREPVQKEIKTENGSWVEVRIYPILDYKQNVEYIVEWVRDITERKETEEKIRYYSFHDKVTGLYNRAFAEQEIDRLDTDRQLPMSIIMGDINGLKLVNDTYGHDVGDDMIKMAAGVLQISCRKEDIIARWGGDEFVILLPQTSEEEVRNICNRIDRNCRESSLENIPISMTTGFGVKTDTDKQLSETLVEAEDNMYKRKLNQSRSQKSAVLKALLNTLSEKSFETEMHVKRMKDMAFKIGQMIGLSESELDSLDLLISLHDIGKINVSGEVLTKQGPLSRDEEELVKRHPEAGYRIARSVEEFAHIAGEILSHHERFDGKGYPQGLKGKDIPLLSRITAVVDAYEVMANGRPYKKAMSQEEIISELKSCSGYQFDPELVNALISILEADKV